MQSEPLMSMVRFYADSDSYTRICLFVCEEYICVNYVCLVDWMNG